MVIPCQWNKIENTLFHYLVKDTEEKTSIYNRYGQMLSECQWKAVEYLWSSEETFQVQAENGLWGVLDGKGTLVFQCVWKSIVKDNSLLYVTDNEGRVWVMNVQGEMLEPCRWAEIKKGDRSEGRIVIDWNGKYGYLNKKWELSIPCQWRDMQYAFNSFIVCDPYGKYGVIGMDGSIIINCEWGMVGHTEGILYSVQDKNGLWGAFDWKGNKILVMGNKHLWGWLDLNGGIIIPCTYPSDSALLDDMKTSRNKGITTTDVFRIDDEKLEVTKYQRWQSEHEIPLSELTLPWNLKHDEFTGEVIKDKAYELCVKAAPRFKELVELIKKNKV